MRITARQKARLLKLAAVLILALPFLALYPAWVAVAKISESLVRCKVELDRTVLPAGAPRKAVMKVTLAAARPTKKMKRPSVNLAIVLDRSSSMTGPKLGKAKSGLLQALRRLESKDVFSVVAYNHEIDTVVPAQSAKNAEMIEARVRGIRASGRTALFGGVSQGAAEIRKHLDGKYFHRIILLSDGLANVGPRSPEDLGRLGVALGKEGISVSTVGVGSDYNEDLMTRLSQSSDGNTYFVESSDDLPRIFAAELGDVLSVVAKNVRITIQCAKGVKPLTIIGRDGRISGQTVELSLNQLYGGQEKFALVEIEVPTGKSGEEKEIAVAQVSYKNPFTQIAETSSGRAKVRLSADSTEVRKSANVVAIKDYWLNLSAGAQDKAIALADSGKIQEAAKELRRSANTLREQAENFKIPALTKRAAELETQAAEIAARGMTRKSRKLLRTDSYQTRNQQMHR
ncbi:VWA domain-containing protein [Thermodesulfobacteriota bacterium]